MRFYIEGKIPIKVPCRSFISPRPSQCLVRPHKYRRCRGRSQLLGDVERCQPPKTTNPQSSFAVDFHHSRSSTENLESVHTMSSDGCQPMPRAQYPIHGQRHWYAYDEAHKRNSAADHHTLPQQRPRGNTGTWCVGGTLAHVIHYFNPKLSLASVSKLRHTSRFAGFVLLSICYTFQGHTERVRLFGSHP